MELILVRHGVTPGNLEKRFVGSTDQPLAPEGEEMARETSALMPEVEHLYISPMLRCRQTAAFLWPGMVEANKTIIPDLRETDFGPFEGRCVAELVDDPLYKRWCSGEVTAGEPVEFVNDRATKALEEIEAHCAANGFQRVGVVAHGGLLMGMLSRHGEPKRAYYDWMLPNCGGFQAELTNHPLTLHVLGNVGRSGK